MTIAALNGAKLWFDDWGGTGEPILLHHGYTATRENWGYDGDPRLVVATGTLLRQPAQRKHQTKAICERERSESALTYLLALLGMCAGVLRQALAGFSWPSGTGSSSWNAVERAILSTRDLSLSNSTRWMS